MNDVTTVLEMVCTLFLQLAAGIALLCFARLCWIASYTVTTDSCLLTENEDRIGNESQEIEARTPKPSAPALKRLHMDNEPGSERFKAETPDLEDAIECGNCHWEIRTKPVLQQLSPEGGHEIYLCEHCGSRVQMPL